MLNRTVQNTLVAAMAVCAVAAAPAFSKPMPKDARAESPTSSLAGTTSKRQDLRGERAQDAARHAPFGHPTWHLRPEPASVAPDPVPAKDGGGDEAWLLLGIGLASAGTAGGAARHYRVRARRVAA